MARTASARLSADWSMRTTMPDPRHILALAAAVLAFLTSGCGASTAEKSELPLRNDFSDCNDFTMNDDVATVDCLDGELRVLVSKPASSPIHIVPFRFDPAVERLVVEADVRLEAGKGAYGLGCAVSDPGEPGRGYLFMMVHGDPNQEGVATIVRLDWTEAEGQTLQSVGFKRKAVLAQKPHRLRGDCVTAADGSAQLTMTVDGRVVVKARDQDSLGSVTAAIPTVIAVAPDSAVRFDNLRVDAVPR
jgi:hypothetical protein